MPERSRVVFIAGATGLVGGIVARKLLAAGVPVRASGRNREKLAALAEAGAETVELDLLDRSAVERACEGVGQVYTGVNNVMGRGASSPNRVDLAAHESLCSGAKRAGVRRLVYLSGRGMTADGPVDFFRVKHAIEGCIRSSSIPFVMLQAGAFMETWVGMLAEGMKKKKGVAVLFGDGRMISNFIAVEDVAEFIVRILAREEIVNETIEVGGPSNISFETLVSLLETRMGIQVKRRRIPRNVLWIGGLVLQPFNEVAARLMRMGYFVATCNGQLLEWKVAADRFGLVPISIDAFVREISYAQPRTA